jgi:hypothetical protein
VTEALPPPPLLLPAALVSPAAEPPLPEVLESGAAGSLEHAALKTSAGKNTGKNTGQSAEKSRREVTPRHYAPKFGPRRPTESL